MNNIVKIREATASDKNWIIKIMIDYLSSYYNEDYITYANESLYVHFQASANKTRLFSFEQKIFIATMNDQAVGMIHIVGKRQGTYKICSLIILSDVRRQGVGTFLLDWTEQYINEKHNIRQIYCPIAEANNIAKKFFENNGFIKAGISDNQYKIGVAEAMYYKPLDFNNILNELDTGTVSVIEMSESPTSIKDDVWQELLNALPNFFDGMDNTWIDSLFNKYRLHNNEEADQESTLIYVALDQNKQLVGLAVTTLRKDAPVKIMPLIARNQVALIALLTDLPYQLSKFSRKLYIHITPNVDNVKLLQLKEWNHDFDMPDAYRQNVITQQWSYEFKSDITRFIRVKTPFLRAIKDKKKTVEIRVAYATIKEIKVGDKINFITFTDKVCVTIKMIKSYKSLDEIFEYESYENIMPGAKDAIAVKELLNVFYPPEKINKFGILAFHFEAESTG